jgi:GAF domain-containing protein
MIPDQVTTEGTGLADDQLIALHEVTRALAREKNLPAALRLIVEKARQLTRSASTALCRLDESRENLDFAAVAGRGAVEMVGQSVRVADALPGHTAVTGEQLLAYNPLRSTPVEDRGKHPYPAPTDDSQTFVLSGGIRSAAIVPVYVNGISIGSLGSIDRVDGESFTGKDLLILHILASAAAVAIQQENLRRERGAAIRERDILQEAGKATTSTLNSQEILDGILNTVAKSVDMFAACVFLLNDERTHLFIAASRGLSDEDREIQLLADGRMANAAFAYGNAFIISNPELDLRYEQIFPDDRPQPLSWMVAPLVSREAQLGLIVIASLARDAYTREDLRLLTAVAAPAAVAMENAQLYEEATRRTEEATAIYELSQAVNTNLNLNHVLNFVADSVIALLHVDKFALFLHNPQSQCLEIKVARNIRREAVNGMRPDRTEGGVAWWVFEYETPTAITSVATDHRNRSLPIDSEGVESLVSVPLQAGDDVIGVMHAMSSRRRSFTVGEMELLYTIANQVGVAISNIQIIEDTRQKSEELRRASRRVARALGTTGSLAQTADSIVALASEIMRADKCLLYAYDTTADTLGVRAAQGVRVPAGLALPRPAAGEREPTARTILRKGRSVVMDNPLHDSRFAPCAELATQLAKVASYLGMPLKIGTEVVGVLEVYSRDPRTFPTDELRQYVAFAAQAAVALQNAMLVEAAVRQKVDLDLLVQIAHLIAEGNSDELGGDVVALLQTSLNAKAVLLLVKPTARNKALKDASCGLPEDMHLWRDGLTAVGRMAGESEATFTHLAGRQLADTGTDTALQPYADLAHASIIAAPMRGGALVVARDPGVPPFDGNDVQIIETAARVLGPVAKRTVSQSAAL